MGRCNSELCTVVRTLLRDRLLLAKLAAGTPQFYNPLEAMAAQALRDQVLAAPGAIRTMPEDPPPERKTRERRRERRYGSHR